MGQVEINPGKPAENRTKDPLTLYLGGELIMGSRGGSDRTLPHPSQPKENPHDLQDPQQPGRGQRLCTR